MRRLLAAPAVALLLLVPLLPAGLSTNAVVAAPRLPAPLVGAASASLDGAAYALGGRFADGGYSDAILAFDGATTTRAGTLPAASRGDVGGARYAGAAVALGGVVYHFGGVTMENGTLGGQPATLPAPLPDVVAFDPATGVARTTADRLPEGAWGMSIVEKDGVAYLLGGFTLEVSTYTFERHDWVLRFDPSQPEGQRLARLPVTLPYAVQDAAAARVGSHAYLLGGLADNGTANPCPNGASLCLTARVVDMDLDAGVATVAPFGLPQPLQFAAAFASGDDITLLGGLQTDGDATAQMVDVSPAAGAVVVETATLPEPECGAALAPSPSGAWLLGGRLGEANNLTDAIVRVEGAPAFDDAPDGLRAHLTGMSVDLSWRAPAHGADGYRVWRDDALLGDTAGAAWHDEPARGLHQYRVAALVAGEPRAAALVQADTRIVPSAVRDLAASPAGLDAPGLARLVRLQWQPPAEEGGAPLEGALVTRVGSLGETTFRLGWTTGFVDDVPLAEGDVTYHVVARNDVGAGPDASVASPLASALNAT